MNPWHDEIRMGEREVGDWRDKHQECLWYGKVRDVCKEQTVVQCDLSGGSVKEPSTR